MTTPLFSDEVMLAGWRDSHNSGATVTFWVGDSEMLDAFRGLTIRKGKTAGQRLAMVLVEINDDETLVEPEKDRPGPLCILAVNWCKDPVFSKWLLRKYGVDMDAGLSPELAARRAIHRICEVQKRTELDTDEQAANRFQTLIRGPYMTYQQTGVIE